MLQEKRDQFLAVTIQDVVDVANNYILSKMDSGESSKVIFGAEGNKEMDTLSDLGELPYLIL